MDLQEEGKLDKSKATAALVALGKHNEAEFSAYIEKCFESETATIDKAVFSDLCKSVGIEEYSENSNKLLDGLRTLKAAFKKVDKDGSGCVLLRIVWPNANIPVNFYSLRDSAQGH